MTNNRLYLYDTTLRDGAQTQGVDFSPGDKTLISEALDDLGIDYIEGGWPGANPTDDAFFADKPSLAHSKLTAFGMTRRADRSVSNDPSLNGVLNSGVKAFCLVGKSWDFQVDVALGITKEQNLETIKDSLAAAAQKGEAIFDAEHFFDGFKANPAYALSCLSAAQDGGAKWIVLCDTNGGTLPHEIEEIVREVAKTITPEKLGIHTHDDTGNAVANSIAAIRAGCRMIQGTLNGLGERCGNANLVSLIPTLILKMGYDVGIDAENLHKLRKVSLLLDEILNRQPNTGAPYVGERAFVHKGGLHASAVQKNPSCYEHITPELVGNRRHIVMSDQAGRSNVIARFKEMGIDVDPQDRAVQTLVDIVKQQEFEGFSYDTAAASFEVLAKRTLGKIPQYFNLLNFDVSVERLYTETGNLIATSKASTKVRVGEIITHTVDEGNGPVNALDNALRRALREHYPQVEDVQLVDYRVRILQAKAATGAHTRVLIGSRTEDKPDDIWFTVGVSSNIIDASYNALRDSYIYYLMKKNVPAVR